MFVWHYFCNLIVEEFMCLVSWVNLETIWKTGLIFVLRTPKCHESTGYNLMTHKLNESKAAVSLGDDITK